MKAVLSAEKGVLATEDDIKLIQAYADDKKRPEIAISLKIDIRALDGRLKRLKDKTGIKTIGGLVAVFYKAGLIE